MEKNKNNASNSKVFGRWPQTASLDILKRWSLRETEEAVVYNFLCSSTKERESAWIAPTNFRLGGHPIGMGLDCFLD